MMVLAHLLEEISESVLPSLSLPLRTQQEGAVYQPERESSPQTDHVGT